MKAVVPLLITLLVVGILNLLQGFGVLGGAKAGGTSYDYAVYTVDEVGLMIKYLIDEDFKKEGKTEYSASILENPRITLPRLMNYMSGEGWELVEIKENGIHFFRRPQGSSLGEPGEPRLSRKAADESAAAEEGADAAAPAPAAGDDAAAPAAAPASE